MVGSFSNPFSNKLVAFYFGTNKSNEFFLSDFEKYTLIF